MRQRWLSGEWQVWLFGEVFVQLWFSYVGPEFLGLSCGSSVVQRWIASVYVAQIWCRCGAVADGSIMVQLCFSVGSYLIQRGVAKGVT